MRRLPTLALALAMVAVACGGGTTTSTAPPDTAAPVTAAPTTAPQPTAAPTTTPPPPPPTTAAPGRSGAIFAITSVSLAAAGPSLVITNIGDSPGSLAGYWLCQRPSYVELPDVELAPFEFIGVSLGGSEFLPPPGAKDTFDASGKLGNIAAESGEVGLYSRGDFGSSGAIVDYVEWGMAGHGRTSVAVEAGIWPGGGFVPTDGDTSAISANVTPTDGPEDWDVL